MQTRTSEMEGVEWEEAVCVLALRDGLVLLGPRLSEMGHGQTGAPGGKLDQVLVDGELVLEDPLVGGLRELLEETSLVGHNPRMLTFESRDEFPAQGRRFRTRFMVVDIADGDEPVAMEPHKCPLWSFVDLDQHEGPIYPPLIEIRDTVDYRSA